MKKQFELKSWLSENRQVVIDQYNKTSTHQFFSGISLKDFMYQILDTMVVNNIKSENTASKKLPVIMEHICSNNTKIEVVRDRDSEMKAKYNNTAYMALV